MPGIGDPAPQFAGTDVLTGDPFALVAHQGEIVLVAFNGITWCGPCQFEAPILQDVWQEFQFNVPPHVQFVMISVNDSDALVNKLNAVGITMPVLVDPAIIAAYDVNAVPALFTIDPEQKICAKKIGASPPEDALHEELRQLLITCGAGGPMPTIDPNHWAAVAIMILGGVTKDGGGVVITPGGHPIPVDPWGPLRRLSRAQREAVMALAVGKLARDFGSGRSRRGLEVAALEALEAAVARLRGEVEVAGSLERDRMPVRS
jgi:thiol-disulfide isomerase/thioredoxin